MKKKIIVLIMALFLLSGCSATVDVSILTGGNVDESITIDFPTDNNYDTKEKVKNSMRNYYPVFYQNWVTDDQKDIKLEDVNYYIKTVNETSNGYKFNYKNTYTLDEYINASTVNVALGYTKFYVREQSNYIEFSSNAGIRFLDNYSNLDSVIVNIKTNYKVLSTSADKVENNVYTWVFNKKNNSTKSIYFKFEYDRNNLPATMVEDIIDNNRGRAVSSTSGTNIKEVTTSSVSANNSTTTNNNVSNETTTNISSNSKEDNTSNNKEETNNEEDNKAEDIANDIFMVIGIVFLIVVCVFILVTLKKIQASKLK